MIINEISNLAKKLPLKLPPLSNPFYGFKSRFSSQSLIPAPAKAL